MTTGILDDFKQDAEVFPLVYALHPEDNKNVFICSKREEFLAIAKTLNVKAIVIEKFSFNEVFFEFDPSDSKDERFELFYEIPHDDASPTIVDARVWNHSLKTYVVHIDEIAWFNAAVVSEGSIFSYSEEADWYTNFLTDMESAYDAYGKHLAASRRCP